MYVIKLPLHNFKMLEIVWGKRCAVISQPKVICQLSASGSAWPIISIKCCILHHQYRTRNYKNVYTYNLLYTLQNCLFRIFKYQQLLEELAVWHFCSPTHSFPRISHWHFSLHSTSARCHRYGSCPGPTTPPIYLSWTTSILWSCISKHKTSTTITTTGATNIYNIWRLQSSS